MSAAEGHEGAINDVVMVDERTLASCSADRSVKIWDFAPNEAGGSKMRTSMADCHKGQNVLVLCRISEVGGRSVHPVACGSETEPVDLIGREEEGGREDSIDPSKPLWRCR